MLGHDRFLAKRRRASVGRPRGEVSDAVIGVLHLHGPLTAREIAGQLQLSVNIAEFTCSRLHMRGELMIADTVRVPGANRPVRRYDVTASVRSARPQRLPDAFFTGRGT